jgi:hypothetical protein
MASKIGMAISGANGNGTHRDSGDDAKASNGDAEDSKGESKAGEGDESNSDGIVKQLMSNLPTSGAKQDQSAPWSRPFLFCLDLFQMT